MRVSNKNTTIIFFRKYFHRQYNQTNLWNIRVCTDDKISEEDMYIHTQSLFNHSV